MGSKRRPTAELNPNRPGANNQQQTKGSLPPKPTSQKRTRNQMLSGTTPPTPNLAHQGRPRRSWSRRSASWSPEEDTMLIQLVRKETSTPPSITASKTWSRVAAQLTNRTGKQCRERYLNQLKPGIRRDPWSSEEENILHEAHARFGNKWVTIANQLPGRTDNCVKNHWNSMLRKRQRREAALKAAVTDGALKPDPMSNAVGERDRKSDADNSAFTGCATPSGASSSNHEVPLSSGIPSPFTASSPITPRRDAKLQISSLVAATSKELPRWNEHRIEKGFIGEPRLPPPPVGEGTIQFPSANRTGSRNVSHRISERDERVCEDRGYGSLPSSNGREMFYYHHNAETRDSSTVQPSGSLYERNMTSQARDYGVSKNSDQSRAPPRRSSRLTGAPMRGPETTPIRNSRPVGIQKRVSMKGKRCQQTVGNPLAALAAAASSVPPSPLTPESQFSGTSRSRSASPLPREMLDRAGGIEHSRGVSRAYGKASRRAVVDKAKVVTRGSLDRSGNGDNVAKTTKGTSHTMKKTSSEFAAMDTRRKSSRKSNDCGDVQSCICKK